VKAQLSSLGKNQDKDSLIKLIREEQVDTIRIKHLIYLSREVSRYNIDSALFLGNQALYLSRENHWQKGEALSKIILAWCKIVQGNYAPALKLLNSSYEIGVSTNDKFIVSVALTNLGTVYHNEKDYDKAISYFKRSLSIDQSIDNQWGIARNFGVIGTTLLKIKRYDEAIASFKKAYEITVKIGNVNGSAIWLSNIAEVYREKGQLDLALEYFQQALNIFIQLHNYWVAAENRISISKILLEKRKFEDAAFHLYKALEEARLVKALDREKDCYKSLSEVYEQSTILLSDSMGKYTLSAIVMKEYALSFLKKSMYLNEIVFSKEKQIEIQRFEEAKRDEVKEAEINYEKKRRNIFIAISLISSIGLIITIFLALFAKRKLIENKKFSNELKQKNILILNKQTEITESIQYAKRIQNAILPAKSSIAKGFPNSFILFKPKDIVSGDFYWYQERDEKKYIAVCDCTGHGVPGALMSMVATDMLNEALIHSSEVDEILAFTNKRIKEALKQSNDSESTRDGMDLVLCCFNEKTNMVQYAGANRPLWLIRPNRNIESGFTEYELLEFKASKAAIGGHTGEQQIFAMNEIKAQKGDVFYLSSDGYADQFSFTNKKFMTKRFKELLLQIQEHSMTEQEAILKSSIESWQDQAEQTDDILVIGISWAGESTAGI
jgi:serine phosphatase RsbU (regulator of sigma subunit)/Tfp pilus assembly protein PilF